MSELIIKVEWYSPVDISFNGYRIMSQEDWNQLQESIKSDADVCLISSENLIVVTGEDSCPASELSDAFSIFSGPGAEHPSFDAPMTEEDHQNTLESFKKLFPGGDVGDTSIIDSVFDAELNSDDGGDFEQMDEDGEEDEERKVLTREIAELALNDPNNTEELALNEFTSIEDEAAESLSKFPGEINGDPAPAELYLDGLTELSSSAAESLSKVQATLSLNGIMGLGNRTAKSLAKFQGHSLFLGITTTSDPVAKIMSEFKCGQLWLSLMEISDEAAVSLSQFKGELGLTCLSELSDAAAKSLSKHSGEDLHFSTEIEISDLAMNYLSEFKGRINCMDPKEWLESMKDG